MLLALREPLLGQPVVVEDLGQVLVSAVANERDHALRFALVAAIAQRGREKGSGRDPARSPPWRADRGPPPCSDDR